MRCCTTSGDRQAELSIICTPILLHIRLHVSVRWQVVLHDQRQGYTLDSQPRLLFLRPWRSVDPDPDLACHLVETGLPLPGPELAPEPGEEDEAE
jgi:hypothetical protein